jgi:hypothetical protein
MGISFGIKLGWMGLVKKPKKGGFRPKRAERGEKAGKSKKIL